MSALFSKSSLWGHRFVFILNWKANCENSLKDIPVGGRHVAIALENLPKTLLKTWQKSAQKVHEFFKKVLEF